VREWWSSVPERRKRDWLSATAVHRHWKASLKPRDPDAKRSPTPIDKERMANAALQEDLHKAEEELKRLKTGDEYSRFEIDRDPAEEIGRAIGGAWRASPTKIATL
jgi:hypothetical protein